MAPGRSGVPLVDGAAGLPRGPDSLRRAHSALRPDDRRGDGRGREGDVLLRFPRRAAHAASRGHRRRRARLRRAQGPQRGAGLPLVLPRADVPRRAPREGPLPPVLPGRRGVLRRRRPRLRRGDDRRARRLPRRDRDPEARRLHQLDRRSRDPCKVQASTGRVPRADEGHAQRGLAAEARDEPAPHPRLEGPRRQGRHRGRAHHPRAPVRRGPRALGRPAPQPRRARHAVHRRPEARARPRLLRPYPLRDQRRVRQARRRKHARRRRPLRQHGRRARRSRGPGHRLRRRPRAPAHRERGRGSRERRRRRDRADRRPRDLARRSSSGATSARPASAARSTRARPR